MRTLATAAVVGLGLLAGTAATGHAQYYISTDGRAPTRGRLTTTRDTRATRELHGITTIRGMATRTTIRHITTMRAPPMRLPRHTGTPMSACVRIPTTQDRKRVGTAARNR